MDDWDVDFSEYYDPGTGDKDARDMADIRRTHSKKQTYKKAKQFLNKPSKIGQFERHSKVRYNVEQSLILWSIANDLRLGCNLQHNDIVNKASLLSV